MIKTGERYLICQDNMPRTAPFAVKVLEIAPSYLYVKLEREYPHSATWMIYDPKFNSFRNNFSQNISYSIIERLKKNG